MTVRLGLRRGGDPEVGALVVVATGFIVALVTAVPAGDLDDLSFDELWPFFVIGLAVPGLTQILFVHAVRGVGAARTAILVGVGPLVSALLAITVFDEPLQAGLVAGTVLVVGGGIALAGERVRPADFRAFGAAIALVCAVLFGMRDNAVRWANEEGAPLMAATATSLLAASLFVLAYVLVARRARLARQLRVAAPAFAPAGVTLGLAYTAVIVALDRGRVTVVAPLNATQSLWGVLLAVVFFGSLELVGRRTVLAGLLVVAGAVIVSATR